jgi:hypothetical protein
MVNKVLIALGLMCLTGGLIRKTQHRRSWRRDTCWRCGSRSSSVLPRHSGSSIGSSKSWDVQGGGDVEDDGVALPAAAAPKWSVQRERCGREIRSWWTSSNVPLAPLLLLYMCSVTGTHNHKLIDAPDQGARQNGSETRSRSVSVPVGITKPTFSPLTST